MSMSEEEINALNESMKQLNEATTLMVQTLGAMSNQSNLTARSMGKVNTAAKESSEDLDALGGSSIKTKGALDNLERSTTKQRENQDLLRKASQQAISAVTGFGDALLSTEPGLTKYGGTVKSVTGSMGSLVSMLGPLGKVLGGVIKLVGMLGAEALKYTDVIVSSRNELYNIGAAGSFTASRLHELAKTTGVTYQNMEVLIKPLKGLGAGLISMGGSVGGGIERFIQIAEVTDDVRKSFYRLGLNADELREEQADFITLQRLSGIQMSTQFTSTKDLRQGSLEYIKNLRELAAITGKDVDKIKQEQQVAANQAQLQIRNFQLQQQEAELREEFKKTGNKALEAEADKIKAMRLSENALIQAAAVMGKDALDAATEFVATGGNIASQAGAKLLLWGVDLDEMRNRMKRGDMDIGAFFQEQVYSSVRGIAEGSLGTAMTFSEELRNTFGFSAELVAQALALASVDITKLSQEEFAKRIAAMKEGFDPDADAKANAQALEIASRVAFAGVVEYVQGPLIRALNWLADAAKFAGDALAWFSSDGRRRLREEEEREDQEAKRKKVQEDRSIKREELATQIATDNPNLTAAEVLIQATQEEATQYLASLQDQEKTMQQIISNAARGRSGALAQVNRRQILAELQKDILNVKVELNEEDTETTLENVEPNPPAPQVQPMPQNRTAGRSRRSRAADQADVVAASVIATPSGQDKEPEARNPENQQEPQILIGSGPIARDRSAQDSVQPNITSEQRRVAAQQTRDASIASPRNVEAASTVPTPDQITTRITPEQQSTVTPAPQIAQNNVENKTAEGLENMTHELASRLERVIYLLDNGNAIQEKLYRINA